MLKKIIAICIVVAVGVGVLSLFYYTGDIIRFLNNNMKAKVKINGKIVNAEQIAFENSLKNKDILVQPEDSWINKNETRPPCTKLPDGWRLEFNTIIKEYRICAPHKDCTVISLYPTKEAATAEACRMQIFGIRNGYIDEGWEKIK